MNSSRLMNPSPSASTSSIIIFSSSSGTSCPRLVIMDPSSEAEILPSPLTSNFLKTCSSSSICALERTESEPEWRRLIPPPGNSAALLLPMLPSLSTLRVEEPRLFFLLRKDLKPAIVVDSIGEEKEKKRWGQLEEREGGRGFYGGNSGEMIGRSGRGERKL
ncbi:hypothetical protein Dimus_031049 [Dionaea muscipula]